MKKYQFKKALPIWAADGEKLNRCLLFETFVSKTEGLVLKMAGHFSYELFINGKFVHYGPARAGRGHFKVDEIKLDKYLTEEKNRILVLVNGFNCFGYQTAFAPSFLCAEILCGENVLTYTGSEGWKAYEYDAKARYVSRYSRQRYFTEVYDFLSFRPYEGREIAFSTVDVSSFIERDISVPDFECEEILGFIEDGSVFYDENIQYTPHIIVTEKCGENIGFKISEFFINSELEALRCVLTPDSKINMEKSFSLSKNRYVMAEMPVNTTGFVKLKVKCRKDSRLILTFDELLQDGKINHIRMNCINVVIYDLKGGEEYELISAEPYTYKYINAICLSGEIDIEYMGMIRIDFRRDEIKNHLASHADEQIKRIYDAAVETFRQSVVDIYMDCPSRERAGWLCDSFFTSRVEKLLTGESKVEHAFLENFTMEKPFEYIAEGMLPMCYPADHVHGNYIPNWAMWYCLELKEYLERTGDRAFIDDAKEMMYSLLSFFRGFENSDGLLEKLEKWVFIEWSRANDLTQDINYPSNMLYSAFKNTLAELYDDPALAEEAKKLRSVIREKSRMGLFFCDNAVYDENGVAKLSGECTEACQYYAFYMGIATKEEDGELWNVLVNDFGPERNEKYAHIHKANVFIGNYLRLDLLMADGLNDKLEENIRGFFDHMALTTGTLWENLTSHASCCHGFASHVLVWLDHLGYLEDSE